MIAAQHVPLWRPTAALIRSWRRHMGDPAGDSILFPNRSGGRMTRSNVTQRLSLAVAIAGRKDPGLLERPVTPHTLRHTTAMHLLQSGVDITVIALWLGHEDTATTHMYVQADLAMKEQALMKLQPGTAAPGRFRASDNLMSFLKTLRGLIPYEYICKCWTTEPERFNLNPHHQMPGPNT